MKKIIVHGILFGILAAIACIIYNKVYSESLQVDFSIIVSTPAIIGTCLFVTAFASISYHFFSRWVKNNSLVWFNSIFLILSFAAFIGPFSTKLPIDIKSPELFVGLTIPMHLFPVLFWIVTKTLYKYIYEV